MSKNPVDHQEFASAFYASLAMDVSYYAAIWHTYKVGQLLMADLDRICQNYALSMADVHLLGAIRVDSSDNQRATDLAQTLHLSNAVLSTRVAKLVRKGLVNRCPSRTDGRAFILTVTDEGTAVLDAAINSISRQANFVISYRKLSETDQSELVRIMGEIHNHLNRDFISAVRKND